MMEQHENNHHRTMAEVPNGLNIFWLLSGVYCMLIVILSVVICSSHYNTEDVTTLTVDAYYFVLTVIGSAWLISFGAIGTRCGQLAARQEVKSGHTTNRWLKAILVIFGVAIIIKDILELLTTTQYTSEECRKIIFYLAPISEMVFIIAEVNFLFRYSKIHLQEQVTLNRFGTMHVMATNLSIWILVIIDESMANNYNAHTSFPTAIPTSVVPVPQTSQSNLTLLLEACNTTEVMDILNPEHDRMLQQPQSSSYVSTQIFGPKGCTCDTSYCEAVSSAHSYLYPFLVEFSLVASCMIYIVWKNVGTKPHHTAPPIKPSYKFYKAYLGLAFGVFSLIVTIVILIFVNYGIENENTVTEEHYYYSHSKTMAILNGYMVGVELAMLIACLVGGSLYRKDRRELDVHLNLDIVLLLLTLVGVATLDMYYIFSVFISLISPRYDYNWIWGAVYPIVDLIQCIMQVAFILWGSARRPLTTEDLEDHVDSKFPKSQSTNGSSDSGIEVGFQNEAFEIPDIKTPPDVLLEDVVVENKDEISAKDDDDDVFTKDDTDTAKDDDDITKEDEGSTKKVEVFTINGATTRHASDFIEPLSTTKRRDESRSLSAIRRIPKLRRTIEEHALQERIRQHNERPRVAPPSLTRLRIRETLMFLLLCNACLWMFWSLESPDIKELAYPNQYYASHSGGTRNIWNMASMFCLPLAIFYRMHSCACLFEMWSFT